MDRAINSKKIVLSASAKHASTKSATGSAFEVLKAQAALKKNFEALKR